MKRSLLFIGVVLAAFVPTTAANASPSPSHEVSASGQYLFEFDALLKQTVGVDSAPGGVGDFFVICGSTRAACHYGWFY